MTFLRRRYLYESERPSEDEATTTTHPQRWLEGLAAETTTSSIKAPEEATDPDSHAEESEPVDEEDNEEDSEQVIPIPPPPETDVEPDSEDEASEKQDTDTSKGTPDDSPEEKIEGNTEKKGKQEKGKEKKKEKKDHDKKEQKKGHKDGDDDKGKGSAGKSDALKDSGQNLYMEGTEDQKVPLAGNVTMGVVCGDKKGVLSANLCKTAVSMHHHPLIYLLGALVVFGLAYIRCKRCCRRQDERGEYRSLAGYGDVLPSFDDDYSGSYNGSAAGSYDLEEEELEEDDWSKGAQRGIEMSQIQEVNGGLTLEEMNG
eukprot:CAMPEP_0116855694 /NCGR_PEP_ID=MMETSP0418-20121206/19439_1 /TAXON_ID=1158023 /ORGANISM="Astrosyne radiata, Strain 13vi08-1A" /LENGTH=313 /DNA_ID=CAMNT_0004488893 /DNA_START=106 /DNA_END=1047 /DNA_ORIENTATION=+